MSIKLFPTKWYIQFLNIYFKDKKQRFTHIQNIYLFSPKKDKKKLTKSCVEYLRSFIVGRRQKYGFGFAVAQVVDLGGVSLENGLLLTTSPVEHLHISG